MANLFLLLEFPLPFSLKLSTSGYRLIYFLSLLSVCNFIFLFFVDWFSVPLQLEGVKSSIGVKNDFPATKIISDDPIDVERRQKVKEAMLHAWSSYEKYAWGQDELQVILGDIFFSYEFWFIMHPKILESCEKMTNQSYEECVVRFHIFSEAMSNDKQ